MINLQRTVVYRFASLGFSSREISTNEQNTSAQFLIVAINFLYATSHVWCQESNKIVQDISGLLLLLYRFRLWQLITGCSRDRHTSFTHPLGLSVKQPRFLTVCDAQIIMLTKDKTLKTWRNHCCFSNDHFYFTQLFNAGITLHMEEITETHSDEL